MTWRYYQATGNLDRDGDPVGVGYSGTGDGRNNPDMQDVPDTGPLPRGAYTIGEPHDTATHGPYVLRLTPCSGDMCGRAGFLIHGDNSRHDASRGCIILPRAIRETIWNSGDTALTVV